jgi:ankyrin repeat protein
MKMMGFLAGMLFLLLLRGNQVIVLAGEIHQATREGDIEKVRSLLKNNPRLADAKGEKGTKFDGKTALQIAALDGRTEIAELLVKNGASVNTADPSGSVPLHWAAQRGNKEITLLLIENGAKVNVKNNFGVTPLDWATSNNHKEVADLLKAHGAKKSP